MKKLYKFVDMSFFQQILSIFIDLEEQKSPFSPQDLTEHYEQEIADFLLDRVYVATHYEDIKKILEGYKYRSEREKVSILGKAMVQLIQFEQETIMGNNVVISPVPMHWSRYIIRGFDHVGYLARHVTKRQEIPFQKLLKAHYSKRQSKLHKKERIFNREDAFSLIASGIKIPETVFLIDDVISTGSTANACAKILKNAGVKYVYGFFLASNQ